MGVTTLRVEENVSRSSQPRATRLKAIVALKADVKGLHHVGSTILAEDGAKGLLHEAMAKLETSRILLEQSSA